MGQIGLNHIVQVFIRRLLGNLGAYFHQQVLVNAIDDIAFFQGMAQVIHGHEFFVFRSGRQNGHPGAHGVKGDFDKQQWFVCGPGRGGSLKRGF